MKLCCPVVLVSVCLSASSHLLAAESGVEPCECRPAVTNPADLQPTIVGGGVTEQFPAVGLFRTKSKPVTATLVGKRTVLTAAHCIDVGFQHTFELAGRTYAAESVIRHPDFAVNNGDLTRMDPLDRAFNDIALVRLKEAPDVLPAAINSARLAMPLGLLIVGYGETRLNRDDRGTKRMARNTLDKLTINKLQFNGEGSVCHGDSGGPSFAVIDGELLVVGVHSVVSNPCGSFGVDVRVDFYLDWLKQASEGDITIGPTRRQ
jgi:secreted trypsin-like serine protease